MLPYEEMQTKIAVTLGTRPEIVKMGRVEMKKRR